MGSILTGTLMFAADGFDKDILVLIKGYNRNLASKYSFVCFLRFDVLRKKLATFEFQKYTLFAAKKMAANVTRESIFVLTILSAKTGISVVFLANFEAFCVLSPSTAHCLKPDRFVAASCNARAAARWSEASSARFAARLLWPTKACAQPKTRFAAKLCQSLLCELG